MHVQYWLLVLCVIYCIVYISICGIISHTVRVSLSILFDVCAQIGTLPTLHAWGLSVPREHPLSHWNLSKHPWPSADYR